MYSIKKTLICNDFLAKEENWPEQTKNRDLNTIMEYHKNEPLNLINKFNGSHRILEVGAGSGIFIRNLRNLNPWVKLHAITAAKISDNNLKNINEVTYSTVPSSMPWLIRHQEKKFNLIFDTYASLTYSSNPVHCLIYLILVMAPEAKLYAISSLTPNNTEDSVFGDSRTRDKTINWFKQNLNIQVVFSLVKIESRACIKGKMMEDLQIRVAVPKQGINFSHSLQALAQLKSPAEIFHKLCTLCDEQIGICRSKKAAASAFQMDNYSIIMREYIPVRPELKIQSAVKACHLSDDSFNSQLSSCLL